MAAQINERVLPSLDSLRITEPQPLFFFIFIFGKSQHLSLCVCGQDNWDASLLTHAAPHHHPWLPAPPLVRLLVSNVK